MKNVLLVLIALMGLTANADVKIPAKHYNIVTSKFDPAHVRTAGSGTMTIDYQKNEVSLFVVREFHCPAGALCAPAVPAPLMVTLPIVSIKERECGILVVTAREDLRRTDGALSQISIEDTSHLTCQFFVEYLGKAEYLTKYIDRAGGKVVTARSTMTVRETRNKK